MSCHRFPFCLVSARHSDATAPLHAMQCWCHARTELGVAHADRSLRPTRQVDAIAEQVEKAGFNVGWHEERGIFAVSPVGRRETHELTSEQTFFPQASGRFRAQSFLTFAPKVGRPAAGSRAGVVLPPLAHA